MDGRLLGGRSMIWAILTVYLFAGVITAIVTVCVFPPMEGFRPKIHVRMLALAVFVFLWPVLSLLCVWYLGVVHWSRSRDDIVERQVGIKIGSRSIHGIPVSKPR